MVGGGRGALHSKGTWGCAARKGLFFGKFSLSKGMLFGNSGERKSNFGNSCIEARNFLGLLTGKQGRISPCSPWDICYNTLR